MLKLLRPWWFYFDEAGEGGGSADDGGEGESKKGEDKKGDKGKEDDSGNEEEFDAWLAKQPEDVRKRYDDHQAGLKNALAQERLKTKDVPSMSKRLKELEAKEKERQDAELSELDKATKIASDAQAERDAARQELTEERIRNAILAEASKPVYGTKQRFADPSDAYQMIDLAEVTIEDGKVVGVAPLLQALAKSKAYLLDKGEGNGGGLGTPRGGGKGKGEGERAKPLSGHF